MTVSPTARSTQLVGHVPLRNLARVGHDAGLALELPPRPCVVVPGLVHVLPILPVQPDVPEIVDLDLESEPGGLACCSWNRYGSSGTARPEKAPSSGPSRYRARARRRPPRCTGPRCPGARRSSRRPKTKGPSCGPPGPVRLPAQRLSRALPRGSFVAGMAPRRGWAALGIINTVAAARQENVTHLAASREEISSAASAARSQKVLRFTCSRSTSAIMLQ